MKLKETNALEELGAAIGKGLLAGLAATAAITVSQMIEMKLTKRKPSEVPVKVASEVLAVKPQNQDEKEKVSQEIHWAYGTSLGVMRGIIGLARLKGIPATLAHFSAVWGWSMVMLPIFKASPPVTEQDPKAVAIDGFHHAVYAITAGLVYDALDTGRTESKIDKLTRQLHLHGLIKKLKF